MELIDQVNQDIKTAMIAKDKERLDAVRYLKAMLIENKVSAAPKAEMDVLIAHHKKLKDSLVNFPEGHEIRLKTETEVKVLEAYLPAAISKSEVEKIISEIISKLEKPNMGAVMKELTPQIKGRFDGKEASTLVQAALAPK